MKLKLSLIFLSTFSLISFSDTISFAFTLDLGNTSNSSNSGIGATKRFVPSKIYTYRDGTYIYNGVTTVRGFEKINTGGNAILHRLLNDGWPTTWNFKKSPDPLPGTIRVTNYVACGVGEICLGRKREDKTDYPDDEGVGTQIILSYIPPADSILNTPPENRNVTIGDNIIETRFSWIQKVRSNHEIDGLNSGHGVPSHKIDVHPDQRGFGSPFYNRDTDKFLFEDRPYRDDPWLSHKWTAQLFPVIYTNTKNIITGLETKDVTLYDGLRWGWENRVTGRRRDPNPFCPSPRDVSTNNSNVITNETCGIFYTDLIGGGVGQLLPGYTKNDDSSFAFSLNYPFTYFDKTYNSLYVNNNGNVSFGKPVNTFTPQSLIANTIAPIIAPYWADVDTIAEGSIRVRTDVPNQTIITWDNVGYYPRKQDKLASFQLVLRGDNYNIPPGEGNIGFFYKNVNWETGGSSGGTNGFGGTPAGVGLGDGSANVNPGEQMIAGSMQNGISRLVSNNRIWFNLRNNCTGGSGGGGCSPQVVTTLNSQRTASANTDYTPVLPVNDLNTSTSEIIRSLQNSMLFSPKSSPVSTSNDSWMDELETSANNYWTDHFHNHQTDDVDNYWMNNPDSYWMNDSELSDKSIPVEKSEDNRKKLSAAGISESDTPDVPEPTSPLMILVFGLGIAFKKWKLKEHK